MSARSASDFKYSLPYHQKVLEAIKRKPIEWSDYEAVRQRCRTCATIGAHLQTRGGVKHEAKRLAGVQIHGGIGFTWEHVLHTYYMRALWIQAQHGYAAKHRARIASHLLD